MGASPLSRRGMSVQLKGEAGINAAANLLEKGNVGPERLQRTKALHL